MNKCPYCGERILSVVIDKKMKSFKDFIFKFKKLVISILVLVLITLVSLTSYYVIKNKDVVKEIEYKSIKQVENTDYYSNLSPREIMEEINHQENDLEKYLSGHHTSNKKTGVFLLFYKNLKLVEKALNGYNNYGEAKIELYLGSTYESSEQILLDILRHNHIEGKPIYLQNNESDRMADYYIIVEPSTDVLEIIYEGEGYCGFHINDSYLANSYSKYLNENWKTYINNKKRVYNDLNHQNYFDDGYIIPNSLTVAKWVVMWEKFLKQYPSFELASEINEDILKYSEDVLFRKGTYYYDEKTDKYILSKEVREGCEYFLQYADKNNPSYQKTKEEYEKRKKNNFQSDEWG